MVEIDVAFVDATLVDGLVRNLRHLFDSSVVSYDGVRKQISVGAEWEKIPDFLNKWLRQDRSGTASIHR